MNGLLRTQLARYFGNGGFTAENALGFVSAVDAAYSEADQHATRLVHSITTMCEELEHRNAELTARNARLEHLNALVVDLARNGELAENPYQRITEACGKALGAARASLWQVEGQRMRCLDLFELASGVHSHGTELHASAYPRYFAAIGCERSIAAHDARTDPRTSEFTDGYLVPLGITSMLDAGAFIANKLCGVLCIEHEGKPRTWSAEEISFAGSVSDLLAVAMESQRHRDTQKMLDHQRAFLRQVIDLIPNLIFAKDREGRFTLVNDAAACFYGTTVAELLGKRDVDFNGHADEVEQFRRTDELVLTTLREHVVEAEQVTNADGETRWLHKIKRPIVEPDGRATMLLGVATDITESRRAAAEKERLAASLRQVQKLESLGLLAGGVAHDLNNIMTPVLITASMLIEDHPVGTPLHEDISSILAAAESSRELTGQLLAFGRKQVLSLTTVDLNDVIKKAIRMIGRLVPAAVKVVTRLSDDRALVRADANQLNQVIVNLIMNACDAMPDGGRITIGTALAESMVELTVEDSGTGMDATTLSQIFDPFFTTKELGRGTGLGLATVHGIVEQHRGKIRVESHLGRGTRFSIELPRRDRITEPVPIVIGPQLGAPGNRTILLVEDESPIRRLVNRVLSKEGYEILSAEHADEALELVRGTERKIDLLLTDIVLPGLSGPALYDRIRAHTVDRVIFMSGHARDALDGRPLPPGAVFLSKPFTASALSAAVKAVLQAPA